MTTNSIFGTALPYLTQLPLLLDFIIVYFVIYRLLLIIKNTQAEYLVRGLLFLLIITFLSQFFGFTSLHWLLSKFETVLIILIIIIFQPELRRFLERVGTGNLFSSSFLESEGKSVIIQHLLKTVDTLSKEKIGALIVIEMGTNLSDYIESGITINGTISHELLTSLFYTGTPTHDGAIIIQENKVSAAGCLLPLSETIFPDTRLGTRHRAGLALSEISDALVIIISEETGTLSIAEEGNLTRFLTKESLETRLFSLYKEENNTKDESWLQKLIKNIFKIKG